MNHEIRILSRSSLNLSINTGNELKYIHKLLQIVIDMMIIEIK